MAFLLDKPVAFKKSCFKYKHVPVTFGLLGTAGPGTGGAGLAGTGWPVEIKCRKITWQLWKGRFTDSSSQRH